MDSQEDTLQVQQVVETVYREESRHILATLIRLLGDFDMAEDALHEAFRAALERWPKEGIPANSRSWLISTGRFKAIDAIRRGSRFVAAENPSESNEQAGVADFDFPEEADAIVDDRLRLIFTCCHPALAVDARLALTLREVCGLTTEAIAHAFLTTPSTLAQRIVRAKTKIREARIPYQVPTPAELPARLDSVLHVIYLVFNEGYSASSGESMTRPDFSGEAIRLGRLLHELLPEPEVAGLLSLMLLQESRRLARTTPAGDLILLEDQDRSLWNRELISEGTRLTESTLLSAQPGPFLLQAAIASVHANSPAASATDWGRIVGFYDALLEVAPSPVVELNRAVAVAMHGGLEAGLGIIDTLLKRGKLQNYHLAHAARADLCRRLGKEAEAELSYERALELAQQAPERRFLERRLAQVRKSSAAVSN